MNDKPDIDRESADGRRLSMTDDPADMHAWFLREVLPLEAALTQYLRHNWQNQASVADLLQEVYVRVYEAARTKLPESTKSFVFTTAHNLLVDRVRREKVIPIEAVEDLEALGIAADSPGPDAQVSARDELRRVQTALEQIPPRSREAFVLQVGEQRVVDLGTEFSARRAGDVVKVAVVKGSVLVESSAADLRYVPMTLTAGQMATATPRSISREAPSAGAIQQELNWRRDLLIFDDTPLAEVAERFNRYNSKKLIIADESIAGLKVGGAFPTMGIESFARVAQHILKLHVEDRGDRAVLTR